MDVKSPFCEVIETEDMCVRLAQNPKEIKAAQTLRYDVFYDEMGAIPDPETKKLQSDFDPFDDICDHMLVIDKKRADQNCGVVGTYRLMRRVGAQKAGQFYTAGEFDISKIEAIDGEICEFGRSCIHPDYRSKATLQLLWKALASYTLYYDVRVLFGCASFHGIDPNAIKEELSFLYHYALAPEDLCPEAITENKTEMNVLPKGQVDPKKALFNLPPLIKGYLRLGCMVGKSAFIDKQFNTIDVCILLHRNFITEKYEKHYDKTKEVRK